jgi:hypothetical protein
VRRDSNAWLLLILFGKGLGVRFAVGIEEFLTALLPRSSELGRCDIPIRPAFLRNRTQILPEIFRRGAAKEPVTHVDFVDDETQFEQNRVRDHRVVIRIGLLRDIEVLLHNAPGVGEKRPVRIDPGPEFIRLSNRSRPLLRAKSTLS